MRESAKINKFSDTETRKQYLSVEPLEKSEQKAQMENLFEGFRSPREAKSLYDKIIYSGNSQRSVESLRGLIPVGNFHTSKTFL